MKILIKLKILIKVFEYFHKSLKKRSTIKITNPENGKSLIVEVKSNKIKFEFYNSIITQRIAEDLDLNLKDLILRLF